MHEWKDTCEVGSQLAWTWLARCRTSALAHGRGEKKEGGGSKDKEEQRTRRKTIKTKKDTYSDHFAHYVMNSHFNDQGLLPSICVISLYQIF